jgi:hypothetical protein
VAFKKLYEKLILDLTSKSKDKYFLVPVKEHNSIDFIMGGSPRDYVGIERKIGIHTYFLIRIYSVNSMFGEVTQFDISRKIHLTDFRRDSNSHNFQFRDGIFNVHGEPTDLHDIAKKIDCEINIYEAQNTLKFTPSQALAKIVGIAPLDKITMWDLFSDYVISNNLVTKTKQVIPNKNLRDIFGHIDRNTIRQDQVKEILLKHMEETPPF